MKCLHNIFSDEVIRVSDEEAERIRKDDPLEPKVWRYCGKEEWKKRRVRS